MAIQNLDTMDKPGKDAPEVTEKKMKQEPKSPEIEGLGAHGLDEDFDENIPKLLEETQGGILKSHGREHSRLMFIRFDLRTQSQQDATRKLIGLLAHGVVSKSKLSAGIDENNLQFLANSEELKELVDLEFRITSALDQHVNAEAWSSKDSAPDLITAMHVNLMLSAAGYRALGFAENEIPEDDGFKRGMKHPATSEYLSDPPVESEWEPTYRNELHALLILADDDEDRLDKIAKIIGNLISKHGILVRTEKGRVLREGATKAMKLRELKQLPSIEHFGFRDGISQPLFFRKDIQKAREQGLEYILTLPIRLEMEQCQKTKLKSEENLNNLGTRIEENKARVIEGLKEEDKGKLEDVLIPKEMILDGRKAQINSLEDRIKELLSLRKDINARVAAFFSILEAGEAKLSSAMFNLIGSGFTLSFMNDAVSSVTEIINSWKAELSFALDAQTKSMSQEDADRWKGILNKPSEAINQQLETLKALLEAAKKISSFSASDLLQYQKEGLRILHNIKGQLALLGRSQWDPFAPLGLVLKKENAKVSGFGSFFVFRKLKQDVDAFRKLAKSRASRKTAEEKYASVGLTQPELAEMEEARMVGRTKSGCPLAWGEVGPSQKEKYTPPENFNYEQDSQGQKCPFHSHVRTVNPRGSTGSTYDERSRRIARRGIPYEDGEEKGMLFLCAQSNIRDQFEYMQKLWANNPDFPPNVYPNAGLDPLIGQKRSAPEGNSHLGNNGYASPSDAYGLVKLKGGEYFFAPSLPFLKNLAPDIQSENKSA